MLVGIDVGTQSLKAVVTTDGLEVRGEAAVGYPVAHPAPGHAEQDPGAWLAALRPAIAGALAAAGVDAGAVRGLAVAGQLDGCVPVDGAGRARGPALIWMDRRAVAELPALEPAAFAAATGQVLDAGHLAAKARWLARHRPGAARYQPPVGFVVEALTGAAVIDHALASTSNVYDLAARAWSPALLAAFDLDAAWLPRVDDATAIAGALHAAGAALTGLPAGVPVAVGTGDDFATPLGGGLIAPGRIACVVGTAEVVGALAATPVLDDRAPRLVETHAYPAGGWLIENPGWLAGGAVAWLGALCGVADAAALDALVATTPPGADGVTFVPALTGAMTPEWNPWARGALTGLTPGHGAGHVARAVLEACAHAMRDVVERLAALGVAASSILLLGGGARSDVWAQIRADVAGLPVARARAATRALAAPRCWPRSRPGPPGSRRRGGPAAGPRAGRDAARRPPRRV
ncbi:MAG: hypothetical protein H6709_19680 [Kofleriaceae bacterium]|nr:hypothetical protein [Kofleriaceae bacterium]